MTASITTKAFFKSVAHHTQKLRQTAQNDKGAFFMSKAQRQSRQLKACQSFHFFTKTYFSHCCDTHEASAMQTALYEALPRVVNSPQGQHFCIAAPRGEGKSTLVALVFILWCLMTRRKKYILIIMASARLAQAALEAIAGELCDNMRLEYDFPDMVSLKGYANKSVLISKKGHKIQAIGAGARLRGLRNKTQRPDLVILDDIENDDNVRTLDQRDKLDAWLVKAILPLGPPDGSMDTIYVGTVLHHDSVLARAQQHPLWKKVCFRAIHHWPKRMDLWEKWEKLLVSHDKGDAESFYKKNATQMCHGAKTSWPEKRPLLALMTLRAFIGHAAFDSEYQNNPVDLSTAPFGKLHYWHRREDIWKFFGAVDPSLGKGGAHDHPSAILVGGYDCAKNHLHVVEASIHTRLPAQLIADIIELHKKYDCAMWFIESVQFQEFLRTELIRQAAGRNISLPAMPVIPNKDKKLRIESLQPLISDGLIKFHENHKTLISQMHHWPKGVHDDGPDCLSMLWRHVVQFSPQSTITLSGKKRAMTDFWHDAKSSSSTAAAFSSINRRAWF